MPYWSVFQPFLVDVHSDQLKRGVCELLSLEDAEFLRERLVTAQADGKAGAMWGRHSCLPVGPGSVLIAFAQTGMSAPPWGPE